MKQEGQTREASDEQEPQQAARAEMEAWWAGRMEPVARKEPAEQGAWVEPESGQGAWAELAGQEARTALRRPPGLEGWRKPSSSNKSEAVALQPLGALQRVHSSFSVYRSGASTDCRWKGGTVSGVRLCLGWGFQLPTIVDVVDEVPEAKIPQLLRLPKAEWLTEADVEDLLNISLTIVQIVNLNEEVTGKVPHVSLLLMEIELVGGQSSGGRWKKEDVHLC